MYAERMIKDLHVKLKYLRSRQHLTQKQVAKILNISPSIVSSYETGERTPSTEVLLSLSNLYKCSTDYLLGKDTLPPVNGLDTTGLSDKQIEALTIIINSMKRG